MFSKFKKFNWLKKIRLVYYLITILTLVSGFVVLIITDSTSATATQGGLFTATDSFYGNTSGWAWGENTGWISFNCDHTSLGEPLGGNTCADVEYGILVEDDALYGYAWAESIGWISLNCDQTKLGGSADCTVPYGIINDTNGNLSGYAWSENIGWISFDDPNPADLYQVIIDPAAGIFSGYAWSENAGYINFNGDIGGGGQYYAETLWQANIAPSSRLVADPTLEQPNSGDEKMACDPQVAVCDSAPVEFTVEKNTIVRFSGMVWDCNDTIADLIEKSHTLIGGAWVGPSEDTGDPLIVDCVSGERTFYSVEQDITFSPPDYTPNNIYDFYVSAADEQDLATISTIQVNVIATNQLPYIPKKIPPPADIAMDVGVPVMLNWQETKIDEKLDPDDNFSHYEVYIVYPGGNPANQGDWQVYATCANLAAGITSCEVSGLGKEEIYYWNVIAVDSAAGKSHNPWCDKEADCKTKIP